MARSFLLAYKEQGATGLRRVLAGALALAIRAAVCGSMGSSGCSVVLVPVPSSRRAVRHRGSDVVAALARRSATVLRQAGLDVRVVTGLRHGRSVADSAGLDAARRALNLGGALQVRHDAVASLTGRPVVLVDDLITTGATLAEAARALRAVGTDVLAAATVAATQRRVGGATSRPPDVGAAMPDGPGRATVSRIG